MSATAFTRVQIFQFHVFTTLFIQFFFLNLFCTVRSAHVFDAHRLIQFEKDGDAFGSRRTAVNHLATSVRSLGDDLGRSIVVISIAELTVETLVSLTTGRQGAAALLILLPQPETLVTLSSEVLRAWKEIEQHLLESSYQIPIYFAYADSDLDEVIQTLEDRGKNSNVDGYQFVVTTPEAQEIVTIPVYNFQGMLTGTMKSGGHMPSIAIVASYDTFGAAPGISTGVDFSGSAVVALLELSRIFARFYYDVNTIGSYDIYFVLTGAGQSNYKGADDWIKNVDTNVIHSLEFVLCLDSLGTSNELFFHVSRPADKYPEVSHLYNTFTETAESMNISMEIIQKKIHFQSDRHFQHELFGLQKILSGTMSSRRSSSVQQPSIFDQRHQVSIEILEKNIKFISEALCRFIYNLGTEQNDLEVISGSHGVNKQFMEGWLDFLGKQPRVTAYLDTKGETLTQIQQALERYTSEVTRTTFNLMESKFYKADATPMSVYRVKPFVFDLIFSVSIISYMLFFHLAIKRPRNFQELKQAFS